MNRLINTPPHLAELEFIAGLDEVGRGCLAGPVVTAAVILPKDFYSDLIRDSKKISEKKRKIAFDLIKENAIEISVSFIEPKVIDEVNIQKATFMGMDECIYKLTIKPDHILVDGNSFDTNCDIPYTCVVKGDDTYLSIASASIVAKVLRDEYMNELHKETPHYNWDSNKGYGSKFHIDKIKEIGITENHRLSFLKNILN